MDINSRINQILIYDVTTMSWVNLDIIEVERLEDSHLAQTDAKLKTSDSDTLGMVESVSSIYTSADVDTIRSIIKLSTKQYVSGTHVGQRNYAAKISTDTTSVYFVDVSSSSGLPHTYSKLRLILADGTQLDKDLSDIAYTSSVNHCITIVQSSTDVSETISELLHNLSVNSHITDHLVKLGSIGEIIAMYTVVGTKIKTVDPEMLFNTELAVADKCERGVYIGTVLGLPSKICVLYKNKIISNYISL